MFDVQCGKIHPYKRQLLHIFNILHRFIQIHSGKKCATKRLHIFAGKSSPSDFLAKQIVHLINVTTDLVNNDPVASQFMRVVFIPNFGMSWAESLVTCADLSEQISTASLEAAGTFNMKFAFNGALTIGSRSGTNLEIAQKVGGENIFIFGKSSDDLLALGQAKPYEIINNNFILQGIFRLLDDTLSKISDGAAILPLLSTLRDLDRYFVLTDFTDYLQMQEKVDSHYSDSHQWAQKCIFNISRIGWFSSDRTIREYSSQIWKVPSL
jgi:starch phosphorylase